MSNESVVRKGFLVDANAIAAGVDDRLDFTDLRNQFGPGFCTKHLERKLSATSNPERREQLLVFYRGLELEQVDSATANAAVSLPTIAELIWQEVDATKAGVLQRSKKRRRARTVRNSHTDALHAEAAKRNGLTLVTGDKALADAAEERGGEVKRTP